jgi:integrase/recombinase XerC
MLFLVEEGAVEITPMARMRPPIVPEQPVPVVTDVALRELLAGCEGRDFSRGDNAIIRPLVDTGGRRTEVGALSTDDLDLQSDVTPVLGRSRRPRAVPFGARTGQVP